MGSSPTSGMLKNSAIVIASKTIPSSARGKRKQNKKKEKKTVCGLVPGASFQEQNDCPSLLDGDHEKLAIYILEATDLQIRGSIVVSISACHAEDPGSIPGRGV